MSASHLSAGRFGWLVTALSLCAVVASCSSSPRAATPPETQQGQAEITLTTATEGTDSERSGVELLNLPDEYLDPFQRLDDEGRAALVALHREGHNEVIRQTLDRAEREILWQEANSYIVRPQNQPNAHYSSVFQAAYVNTRPGVDEKRADFAACAKKFGFDATSRSDLLNKYSYRGASQVPHDTTEDQLVDLQERADEAGDECSAQAGEPEGDARQRLAIAASDLRREMKLPAQSTAEPTTGEQRPETRIAQCRKDENGIVYHGGAPQKLDGSPIRQAALTADAAKLKELVASNPAEFRKEKHAWIVPMLTRTGCVEALQAVLQAPIPVVVPELFGEQSTNWDREVWHELGYSASAETFDLLLGRAVAQKPGESKLAKAVSTGICTYPASFAPILQKHGITGKLESGRPDSTRYPLWSDAVNCGRPDFVQAFIADMGDKKPANALAQLVQNVCFAAQPDGQAEHKANSEHAAKIIASLRAIGYNPDEVVTVVDRDGNEQKTSARDIVKYNPCAASVRGALNL